MKAVNFPKSVTIRLNEEQLDRLMMNANLAGQTESEYVRGLICGSKTPIHRIDKEAVRQINKFGNLLNQIAAKLNSGDNLDSSALARIEQIRASMDILVNLILNKNNKSITKTSSNFVNQGINSSQSSCAHSVQEKSTEKTTAEPTPSYADNIIQEDASLDEFLYEENSSDMDNNVDTVSSMSCQDKDNIQFCSDLTCSAVQLNLDAKTKDT
ncbi:hypothetical protein [Campylobacter sp. CCUG 57310]|uniref:plasmid mobilization protein n=1 Tax=Campylobacter sp. CCUG 57310 TaxID=2517362 RepID=UPI001565C96C|nr:hypothetical protein [Campylobacter sp. CCUG 57310]QKF91582.1 hypothetical protein CORI_0352 [Campylobacter sp. CCUG 57310]